MGWRRGPHRWQASSHRVRCSSASHWSAVRPPSRASLAPTRGSVYTLRSSPLIRPSVSSPAALDLDLPAPFGRLSGGVHPGSGAQRRSTQSNTLHVGRREADRRAVSPDGYRSEGTPSLGEGPDAWGETFWFLLWRLTKGTRRKGETASRRYRRNGYVPGQPQHGRPEGRHREQPHSHS